MKQIGIILIVLGAIALAYQGISWTQREKVLEIGDLKVTTEERKSIPLPPILGAMALAGGVAMVIVGSKKG